MEKKLILYVLIVICNFTFAQNQWFTVYTDSTQMVKDANEIVTQFTSQVKKTRPDLKFEIAAVKNTTPYLIFYKDGIINLPFWNEVIQPQKDFFTDVAKGENNGKEVFGLFFNGFYLIHEAGHAILSFMGKKYDNAYYSEYDANALAILYWRKSGEQRRLEECYQYAKKILLTLKSPVPAGEEYKQYITTHYNELSANPYQYGYIQFTQFVEIYEDKRLPDFDTFIKK